MLRRLRFLSVIALSLGLFPAIVQSGEPPFPNEMLYPNVVPPIHQFGTYGSAFGQFVEPSSACFRADNTLVVVDSGNKRLQVLSIDGSFLKTIDLNVPDIFKRGMTHIYCDDDRIVISSESSNEVAIFEWNGNLNVIFGGFGEVAGRFNKPSAVIISGSALYVADSLNHRIQQFSLSGQFIREFGSYGDTNGAFNHPLGISADDTGNIYVADSWNNRIQKFSGDGRHLISWGEWGSHSGLLATPSSIVAIGHHLYVTDLTNHRIQVFDRQGNFLFQWGRHPINGHDGNGRTHYPWKIAINKNESLFALVEPIEHRVQIFSSVQSQKVTNVNDSAWWDKATQFHYGSRAEIGGSILAVSEPDTHSVLLFDVRGPSPVLISRVGGRGTALGNLIEPSGIIINDAAGEVIVSDAGNMRLQTISLVKAGPLGQNNSVTTPGGFITDLARAVSSRSTIYSGITPTPAALTNPEQMRKFSTLARGSYTPGSDERAVYPGAIVRHQNGQIYMFDHVTSNILIIRDNRVLKTFGGYGSENGQFRTVHNMSFSQDGSKLFVVDAFNARIQVFDTDGKYVSQFGRYGYADSEFAHIFGIASGRDGYIYITDEAKNCIYKYTESGQFVARWSRWGTNAGELYKPKGLAQHENGDLYVLSFGNHRGEIFKPSGEFVRSFGLADPDTQRAREVSDMLLTRPAYTVSGRALLNRNASELLNEGRVQAVPANGDTQVVSNGRAFRLNYRTAVPFSATDIPNTIFVEIRSSDGAPVDGLDLDFSMTMPAHGHGSQSRPQVRRIANGQFEIGNVRLGMAGLWELFFDVRKGPEIERAQVAVFAR